LTRGAPQGPDFDRAIVSALTEDVGAGVVSPTSSRRTWSSPRSRCGRSTSPTRSNTRSNETGPLVVSWSHARISDRVFRVQAPYEGNAVHLYLVRGAKLALIDSGAGDSPQAAVAPALRELGLEWSDLDYLLNTHGSPPATPAANGELKAAAPHVQIGIHPADGYLLAGPDAHLTAYRMAAPYALARS